MVTQKSKGPKSLRGNRGSASQVVIVRDIKGTRIPLSKLQVVLTSIIRGERQTGIVQMNIVDDATMRRLNRRFKGRDKTTDVMSFPLGDAMPGTESLAMIGEIYCNYQHCKRWTKDNGGTITDELLRLAVHGCLHLFGYDHHTPDDHRRMQRAEMRYLNQDGLIRARVTAEEEHAS